MSKRRDPSVRQSKFLSLVLRHRPAKIGLTLDDQGWAPVEHVLAGTLMSMKELEHVVATNNKKRFEFNDDKTMIRARQGHSVKVDLGYEARQPPEFLYHGTAEKVLPSIMEKGLLKMNRHHVHMSRDVDTAKTVGRRHGKPVVLMVQSGRMHREGAIFYLSNNDVWLVAHVPPEYLSLIQG